MAISAVMVACFFNGLNTYVWTGWVFFGVALGIVLIWGYTVSMEWYSSKYNFNNSLGYLFHHSSWVVPHTDLRKRPLLVPLRLFLAIAPHYYYPSFASSLPCQGLPVCIQSN